MSMLLQNGRASRNRNHPDMDAPAGPDQPKRSAGRSAQRGFRRRSDRAKSWDAHVRHMEQLADSPGFRYLRAEIILLADLQPDDCVLDIGAGTGLLTLPAASQAAHITALDISPAMCRQLENQLVDHAITNVDVVVGNASELPLADGSIDIILSNYCFHHLRDADKRRALSEARRVLRPGGRIVTGDMMFQVGLRQARDRAVIARFAAQMLRRGPAGVARLVKNLIRLGAGRGEHPAGIDWWRKALDEAGFIDVVVRPLRHEGGIATARQPRPIHLPIASSPLIRAYRSGDPRPARR